MFPTHNLIAAPRQTGRAWRVPRPPTPCSSPLNRLRCPTTRRREEARRARMRCARRAPPDPTMVGCSARFSRTIFLTRLKSTHSSRNFVAARCPIYRERPMGACYYSSTFTNRIPYVRAVSRALSVCLLFHAAQLDLPDRPERFLAARLPGGAACWTPRSMMRTFRLGPSTAFS